MRNESKFAVRIAQWSRDRDALQQIRKQVFVLEQHVPEHLEWDELDDRCTHVLAETTDGVAVGTARMLPDGHIGRMAVLQPWRHCGIGRTMLKTLIQQALCSGLDSVNLNAQTTAIVFYEKAGFTSYGDEFLDAGIPHRRMRRQLNPT